MSNNANNNDRTPAAAQINAQVLLPQWCKNDPLFPFIIQFCSAFHCRFICYPCLEVSMSGEI